MSFRRYFLALLGASLLCAAATGAPAAADWKIVKIGSWDYLTVENIAHFYGFPPGTVAGRSVHLSSGRNSLTLTVDSREAVINGVRNWLCFPVMQKDGQVLLSRVDLSKTIEPQLRPQMIAGLGHVQTVVLDPGHGGFDKGALSSFGCEKDYVLDIARQLKPLLEAKGFKVVMTRESDVFVPLDVRAKIANATRDSIFVSLHLNATDANASAAGFEIYSLTPRGAPSTQDDALAPHFVNMQAGSPVDAPSLALSMSIYHSVVGHLPEFDRGIKRARFAVLRQTRIPAVLMEGGFLTERGESRLIANRDWRAKLAQSICQGIENYKGLVEKHQRPMLLADYQSQLGGQLIARDATAPAPDAVAANAAVAPVSNTRIAPAPSARLTTSAAVITDHENEPAEPTKSAPSPENSSVADTAAAPPQAPPIVDSSLPGTGDAPEKVAPPVAQPSPVESAIPALEKPKAEAKAQKPAWHFGPFPHFQE